MIPVTRKLQRQMRLNDTGEAGEERDNYVRLCRSMTLKGCDQLRHLSESTPAKSDLEGVKLQQRVAGTRVNICKASALRIDGQHRVTRNGQVNSTLRVTGAPSFWRPRSRAAHSLPGTATVGPSRYECASPSL